MLLLLLLREGVCGLWEVHGIASLNHGRAITNSFGGLGAEGGGDRVLGGPKHWRGARGEGKSPGGKGREVCGGCLPPHTCTWLPVPPTPTPLQATV